MRRSFKRALAGAAAGATLGALAVTGAAASGAASWTAGVSPAGASRSSASPGAQLWVSLYSGSIGSSQPSSVTVSRAGKEVFVTGTSYGATGSYDYATVAYDAATGHQLWVERYNDSRNGPDDADSVVVSPNGSTVFVTGSSYQGTSGYDYATVAYNAATGHQLWVRRYTGSGPYQDSSYLAVSPSGKTVFVTGTSYGGSAGYGYATIAYSASTGAQLWVRRYNGYDGPAGADAVAVSPSGKTVFVTGTTSHTGYDYATIAYNAATGAQLWVTRYNGTDNDEDQAASMAVSPTGKTVFVTGYSYGRNTDYDYVYATVAYSAATGAQLWVKRYSGPGGSAPSSIAVSPTGKTVFVTGYSAGTTTRDDYATIAYNAASGAQLWVKRYNGPGNGASEANSIAVNRSGSTVYVTGYSSSTTSDIDYATVAYKAATGAVLWVRRYIYNPAYGDNYAYSAAVSPTSGTVFVTGSAAGNYDTIAYQG